MLKGGYGGGVVVLYCESWWRDKVSVEVGLVDGVKGRDSECGLKRDNMMVCGRQTLNNARPALPAYCR